jgi:phosphohistidine phosphatase SixA
MVDGRNDKKLRIVVMRHPERSADADGITPRGAQQCFAVAEALAERGMSFDRVLASGAHRAWQTAVVMAAGLGYDPGGVEENRRFHLRELFVRVFRADGDREFAAEHARIAEGGGTVAHALRVSAYARLARKRVTRAVLALAEEMAQRKQRMALVVSHSPYAELAAFDPATMPYGIDPADAVIYSIEDGVIIGSRLLRCPVSAPGRTPAR